MLWYFKFTYLDMIFWIFLHLSGKLELQKWQVRVNVKQYTDVQNEFYIYLLGLGRLIDQPK